MLITLKSLKEKNVRSEFIIWFEQIFGEEADSKKVIKKLSGIKDPKGWMEGFFIVYKLSGICKRWYRNERSKKILEKTNYENGKRHGLYEKWDYERRIKYVGTYKDGELVKEET